VALWIFIPIMFGTLFVLLLLAATADGMPS
jgi:hypothetical protein